MNSVCPRCAHPREQRDGPYFVCLDCRWCWTVSITGVIYMQADWPRQAATEEEREAHLTRRLLASVDGLPAKLAQPWPPAGLPSGESSLHAAGLDSQEIARLRHARAATHADFFNEGVPFERLLNEEIRLRPEHEPDRSA